VGIKKISSSLLYCFRGGQHVCERPVLLTIWRVSRVIVYYVYNLIGVANHCACV